MVEAVGWLGLDERERLWRRKQADRRLGRRSGWTEIDVADDVGWPVGERDRRYADREYDSQQESFHPEHHGPPRRPPGRGHKEIAPSPLDRYYAAPRSARRRLPPSAEVSRPRTDADPLARVLLRGARTGCGRARIQEARMTGSDPALARKTYVVDTSILVSAPDALQNLTTNNTVLIPFPVLQELDRRRTATNGVGYTARSTVRFLDEVQSHASLDQLQSGI